MIDGLDGIRGASHQWSIENGDVNNNKIQQLKKQHEIELIAQDRTLSKDEVKSMKSIHQEL